MVNTDFPNVYINTRDNSSAPQKSFSTEPLHRPLFVGFAEKGPIGQPVYCDGLTASKVFGTSLLSGSGPYAQNTPYLYLSRSARSQKFWYMRLDDNSKKQGFYICAVIDTVKGAAVYPLTNLSDASNAFTQAEKDASGNILKADQPMVVYVAVPSTIADNSSDPNALANYLKVDPKDLYVLVRVRGMTPGNFATRYSISIDAKYSDFSVTDFDKSRVPMIRVYPKYCADSNFSYSLGTLTSAEPQFGQTNYNYSPVSTIYGSSYIEGCPTLEDYIDPTTNKQVGINKVIKSSYTSPTQGNLLDIDITFNVNGGTIFNQSSDPMCQQYQGCVALGNRMSNMAAKAYPDRFNSYDISPTSKTASTLTQEDYQNIIGVNPFTGASLTMNALALQQPIGYSHVASDGTDVGIITFGGYSNVCAFDEKTLASTLPPSNGNIDDAIKAYFNTTTGNLEQISDPFYYSFNFMYDPGWSNDTKSAISNLLDVRDDVKIAFSVETFMSNNQTRRALPAWMVTQVTNNTAENLNDIQTSVSSVATLVSNIGSHGVDDEFGTASYRAEVFPQTEWTRNNTGTLVPVPVTYERLIQRLTYYSGTSVSGTPKGRPNSVLSSAESLTWVPVTTDQKQLLWSQGANYATWADSNVLFFPDLRTTYPDDNSLLSSATYTDYIIFLKRIIRVQWTYFTGLEKPIATMITDIERAIDTAAFQAFGAYMTTKTTVNLQDNNTDNNYTALISTDCYGNMPDRIWKTILTAVRNPSTLDQSAAATTRS